MSFTRLWRADLIKRLAWGLGSSTGLPRGKQYWNPTIENNTISAFRPVSTLTGRKAKLNAYKNTNKNTDE